MPALLLQTSLIATVGLVDLEVARLAVQSFRCALVSQVLQQILVATLHDLVAHERTLLDH